ncbi:MAG TPA: hypothetical protein DEA73_06990 [Peptococcaceae bacterium]|nr:hypothetical protein [Peptococcaceae bacterium]
MVYSIKKLQTLRVDVHAAEGHQQKDENNGPAFLLSRRFGPSGPAALAKPRRDGGAEDRKSEAGL